MNDEQMDALIERLTAALVPFICERTTLSSAQVQSVLDANNEFWESRPSVLGQIMLFQLPDDDDEPWQIS